MTDLVAGAALQRWPSFRGVFFQAPNELRLDSGIAPLDHLVATASELLATDPPSPIVLPALITGVTHYFALAFTTDQARTLRQLLQSHIGPTWTNFDGQSVFGRTTNDPLEQAAIAFVGDARRVYRFQVAPSERVVVLKSIQMLLKATLIAPRRQARIFLPIGRLIGDLVDACAAGAEDAAGAAYAILAADHRLSEANRLFLQVQILAAFERWQALEDHPSLGTLLKLARPSLASDALARLAMSKLPDLPDLDAFAPVATQFNALIESVSAIRSAAGARYYTLWALTNGELPLTLRRRLMEAGWSADPVVVALVGPDVGPDASATHATVEELRTRARASIEAGRFDAAVELLSELPTDAADLPAVLESVTHTLTAKAVALLERHRELHGDELLRSSCTPTSRNTSTVDTIALPQRLIEIFATVTTRERLAEHTSSMERTGLAELRAPGGTGAVCQAIDHLTFNDGPERLTPGLDLCIDLVRDLKTSDAPAVDVRSLSYSVLELWAFHDATGDRHRAARMVHLAGDLVELGLGVQTFDEVVELLRAGWDPFCTDADLPIGLDLLEQLIAYRPDDSESLYKFAAPMLSRIGIHNVSRIPSAALAVAVDIAPSFGLSIEISPPVPAESLIAGQVMPGTKIALYSLQEQALERAAKILRGRHPNLEVLVSSDHVATDALRTAARTADLLVIMDRAATHAATIALKAERPTAPIRYAAGKGSTSLIEAAEGWLHDQVPPHGDGNSC